MRGKDLCIADGMQLCGIENQRLEVVHVSSCKLQRPGKTKIYLVATYIACAFSVLILNCIFVAVVSLLIGDHQEIEINIEKQKDRPNQRSKCTKSNTLMVISLSRPLAPCSRIRSCYPLRCALLTWLAPPYSRHSPWSTRGSLNVII